MLFGIGHLAVQVMVVDCQEEIGQHLLRPIIHFADVIAYTCNDHQVGGQLQPAGFTKDLQQGCQILARIGPRQRQDHRFFGFFQKAHELMPDRAVLFAAVGWKKPLQLGTRRDDLHLLRRIMVIEPVLLLDFLVGTRYDEFRGTKNVLFHLDTAGDVVAALDGIALQASKRWRLTRPREWPVWTSGIPRRFDREIPT